MPTIYFDNFRGFEQTFLDLRDINFFVGENSTGKTSVLKLIGIISSQDFWRYGNFGREEINLGSFEDVLTTSHESKSYLEIGIHENIQNEDSEEFAVRLRFIEFNKLPFLKEVCYWNPSENIQAIIEGKTLKYRLVITNPENVEEKFDFKSWLKDNGLNDLAFSKIDIQNIGIIPILTRLNAEILRDSSLSVEMKAIIDKSEIQLPEFVSRLAWIEPIRAKPLPTYRNGGIVYTSDGSHSPSVLKEIFDPQVRHILNKFGADSGLFEDILTKDLFELNDDVLKNLRDNDIAEIKKKIGQSDIFELRLTINQESRNIVNVGYGISQVLPILIEAIAREDNIWFATQNPEVHLHPRAQAALGDFYFKCNTMDGQKFIIETHSDYIIDRFRVRLNRAFREKNKKSGISQIVFFSRTSTGNRLDVIKFNEDGSYPDNQPSAFRDFFVKEQLDIISI
jgi:predicted ATPase